MTKLLIQLAEKRSTPPTLRTRLAGLGSGVCILCNLLLCALKFTVGALTGSVAVTADAVNNLSDSASNIVALTGTKLSDKPDDKEHPFGHGRMEYVSALIVAVSVFVVSFELAKSAVEKIVHPTPLQYSRVYIVLLLLAVAVKLWMAYFNRALYKKTDNLNMKAVMLDSLNDCIATGATVVSLLLREHFGLQRVDGIIGLGVSLFIFCAGVSILKQVISPLLGEAPPRELTEKIISIITESDKVLGVHDLVIHTYGAHKMLASADAEVDGKADIFALHDAIDAAERRVKEELNITICIHMDPVDKTDTQTEKYKFIAEGAVREYNPACSIHDFMLTQEDGKQTMRFDLLLPRDDTTDEATVREELTLRLAALCPDTAAEINVEHSYV